MLREKSQWYGSVDKGPCCQAWQLESDPQNSHSGGESYAHKLSSNLHKYAQVFISALSRGKQKQTNLC